MLVSSVLAVVALAELGVLLRLATRRPEGTERERLLEKDVARLQRALDETTDKLLHVVGRDFNVPPVDVDTPDREPEPDPWENFLSHDELGDESQLLLVPEPAAGSF